jgi:hypothetical protein
MINLKAIKNTTGTTLSQCLKAAILAGCLTIAIFSGCKNSGIGPDNSPAFSNMARLEDKLYVAYKSPDLLEKPDTIKILFNYNSSKVKSIGVQATLDSGQTWIPLGRIIPDNSDKASLPWIPKNDSITFKFCGKKEAFIRVYDSVSNVHIDSDSFLIVGAVPYVLIGPKRKEAFSITDTIKILYTQNQDLSANLTVGFLFMADTGYDFVSISGSNGRTTKLSQSLPIKNFITEFVPINFAEKAKNYTDPITLFVADYGVSAFPVAKADSIRINQ